jgi:hypothetical protein
MKAIGLDNSTVELTLRILFFKTKLALLRKAVR